MKKLLCVVLGIALLGGVVLSTGCSSDGGGILAAVIIGAIIISASASTGGGALAFAAKINDRPKASISATLATKETTNYWAKVYVNGELKQLVTTLKISDADNDDKYDTIELPNGITVSDLAAGKHQYAIEFGYKNSTSFFFKKYGVVEITQTDTKPVSESNIGKKDTAKSLLYEAWQYKSSYKIDEFEKQVATTKVDAVEAKITDTQLQTAIDSGSDLSDAKTEATTQAADVPAPTTTTTTTPTTGTTEPTTGTTEPTTGTTEPTTGGTTTPATTYTVSGYVMAKDGVSGSTGTSLVLTSTTNPGLMFSAVTTNGSFTLYNVPAGTYSLVPSKLDHSYTPSTLTVTVASANVTDQRFAAY
jgi:hypothetical protein